MFVEVEEVVFFILDDWPMINKNVLQSVFVKLEDLFIEDVVYIAWQIGPEMP